jgi:translocation and assembly module TamB
VLSLAAWSFLQSRAFGRLLSKTITEVSSQFDAQVRFSRLDVRFFPPGLALENVNVSYAREGTEIKAQAGELGVSFDVDMFDGDKFRLREVFLNEGSASIYLKDSESSNEHPWDQIQNELEKLPISIGRVSLTNSRLKAFDALVDVQKLEISPNEVSIPINAEVKHLTHKKLGRTIDFVKLEGNLERNLIKVKALQVLQKKSKVTASGSVVEWANLEKLSTDIKFKTDVYVPDVLDLYPIEFVHISDGVLQTDGRASWSKQLGPKVSANFEINSLASNIFKAQELKGKVSSDDRGVALEEMTLLNNAEKLTLHGPVRIWDVQTSKILPSGARASLENLQINNALSILGRELEPLKGELTGEMAFELKGEDLYFTPGEGFKVTNLRLEYDEEGEKSKIFHAPIMWLYGSKFSLVDNAFEMHGKVKGPRTQLDVKGGIRKGQVNFDIMPGPILLADLGNIANLDLKGEGTNQLQVRGTLDDVKMHLKGQFRNFEILGYRLGDTEHEIILDLGEGKVGLPKFSAKKGRYHYSGTGEVAYKDFLMDLTVDLPNISFSDFKDAIHPLADGLDFLPKDFEASMQANVELYAKSDISTLRVDADVYAQKITAYAENFRDSKFNFKYQNKKIALKNFSLAKDTGKAAGNVGYDLTTSTLDYQMSLRDLSSTELAIYKRLPLSLDFKAVGEFQGMQAPGRWRHRGFLGLSQSRIHDKQLPDSTIEWDVRNDSVSVDAKIAKDWVLLSATSVRDRNQTRITGNLDVNIPDLPLFLRGALGENPQLVGATGELDLSTKVSLTDWQWNKADVATWLKVLRLNTNEISLQQRFAAPQVEINDGRIAKWNFKLDAPDFKLTSAANGDLNKNILIKNTIDLDAKYFEVLSRHIQRAEGRAAAELEWLLTGSGVDFEFSTTARDVTISTDLLPFALSNLNYKAVYKEGELDIQSFSFRPDSGKVQASGTVYMRTMTPDVNLRYSLDRATIPIKNRSQVTLTGEGLLFGNKKPYMLNGDITINRGSVLNELGDFVSGTGVSSDIKYLPRDRDGLLTDALHLDVSVNTENPINVTNSMMDVFLVGDLQLTGDAFRPSADGRIQTAGNQSKVFFKNSEYSISKAEFLFSGRKSITKPDFDVAASSVIANYKVTAKAFGNPDNFTFDLSSDPALSKQNILSLIAFGYTDDLSNSITPEERQNLTNVGVGSFIFDQFKVTDIVKKQFGLQVNLGTVFVQSDQSMLAGRSQDQGGAGALARTRTATNIEVKKRLSEAMSLSVSSTVGGSIGQRQRMNLNYGLTRKIQVEGVYELRTNAEGTEDIIDNSIGGDIKYRHTFK